MEEHSDSQPLSDLRVIDLSHGIAGPYGTKLLADFGADVIKVERPGSGDYARRMGPFPGDISHPEKSGLFLFLNTNKRGITLDLKTAEGTDALKELVKGADILVESFKPGVMARLGLDYDTLSKINPNLVMTSVSNFGQTGPYRDYLASELVLYAMGGNMIGSGLPDHYPLKKGGNHVQYQAGNNAAMATLIAWHGRRYNGLDGQHVDISIFETQKGSINGSLGSLLQYQYNGSRSRRRESGSRGYPTGYYRCKDGFVHVNGAGIRWHLTAALLGMPELENDPKFSHPTGQMNPASKEEFERTLWTPWLMQRTTNEVMEDAQKFELLSVSVSTMDQVVDNNPQLKSRGYFVEIDHPVAGRFRYPGAPIFNSNRWWSVRRPAPLLGQHNQEVLQGELGYSQADAKRISGEGNSRRPSNGSGSASTAPVASQTASPPSGGGNGRTRLPLEGIRVIDMTLVLAGPYGTMFLADMGAEVVRVEPLHFLPIGGRGQLARPSKEAEAESPTSGYPDRDPGERPWNRVSGRNVYLRNKYSMTADLTTPEGKDVFRRLVEVSDLVIVNIVVGAMERLGLTYPVISQWNPRIIVISSTGCGETGPWNWYRGYGSSFEALFGHATVMGYPDMGPDGSPGGVASDASTGVTIALAAMMALHQREKTGKGMFIDLSMGENFLPHLGELVMDYTINGRVAGPLGNRDHLGVMVQGVYQCAGDDEWITICLGKIEQWHAISRLMGKPELVEDPRFENMAALRTHHDEVDQIIGAWTADQECIALFHRLQKEGVAAGHLMHEEHAYTDPHLKERGFFVPITAPEVGTHLYPTTTFTMSKSPFEARRPPVRLGEDNDYMYREVLKIPEVEYDRLKALGQIGIDYHPNVK